MVIKFKYLEFKNILSFGNKKTRIDFSEGLHLITGKNGSGKSSSLLDTLSFCLFGSPYRKIKLEELLNRKTKKNLEVTCCFVVNDITYKITRGLKPNKLIIFENNVELNLLSSKYLNNNAIESKIGINYKMFKQIISLSINHNEPFLDSSTPKKREITDELFNITVLTKIDKNIKDEIKDLKLQLKMVETTIQNLTHNIANCNLRLSDAETISKQFETNKQTDLTNISLEIDEKLILRDEVKNKGKLLETELKNFPKLNEVEITQNLDKIKSEISNLEFAIKQNEKTIKFLNSNDVCPTCNITIDENHKLQEISNLKHENFQNLGLISSKQPFLESFTTQLSEIRKLENQKLLKTREKDTYASEFNRYKKEIESLKAKFESIKIRELNIDTSAIFKELQDKTLQLEGFKKDFERLNSNINLNSKLCENIMETGFKSFIYEQLIPILNYNINNYLKLFELPVNINFTNNMDVSIKTLVDNTNGVNYYCFSEGEKKRIDIAILLSFINVTKSLTNWNCNLLIIDELLDSSIDDDGLEKLLLSLENIINNSNDMCVYIISHKIKKEFANQFNSFINLDVNKNNYSEITITTSLK